MEGNAKYEVKFSLPMFRERVPEKLRFYLILLFPIVFQMSDAVFMGMATEISSSTGLTSQDVLMCGFAGMIGVTMMFPLLFRLKFRFMTRQILLTVCIGMALISIVCINTQNVAVLVGLSVVFGMLKLWGSFECFSSIMLKVSPHYNFAPFLTIVFCIVFGSIELSGIVQSAVLEQFPWRFVNLCSISALLTLAAFAFFGMKNFRAMPMQPLHNIRFLDITLWTTFLLSVAYIAVYGGVNDWFNSPKTWVAVLFGVVALALAVHKMLHSRHAFLPAPVFTNRTLWMIVLLYFVAAIIMSTESVLQSTFVHSYLGVSAFGARGLRWSVFVGILVGGWFSTYAIEKLQIDFRKLAILSMLFLTMYQASMAYLTSPDTTLENLVIPNFFYGVGHVMLFITLTTFVEALIPLEYRFEALTFLGFARIGCGSAIGAAFFGHMLQYEMNINLAAMGSQTRGAYLAWISTQEAMSTVSNQALLMSIKNLYEFAALIGVISIVAIAFKRFGVHEIRQRYPSFEKAREIIAKVDS